MLIWEEQNGMSLKAYWGFIDKLIVPIFLIMMSNNANINIKVRRRENMTFLQEKQNFWE